MNSRNRPQPDIDLAVQQITELLSDVYQAEVAQSTAHQLRHLIALYRRAPQYPPLDERDVLLITYADHFLSDHASPLETLREFKNQQLNDSISGVHILPFFPSSGDGGFAISDYEQVDPTHGTWQNIETIAREGRLMVDVVLNHCSKDHPWFRAFLAGDPAYSNFFIEESSDFDTSKVVRPRATPLFTKFESPTGTRSIWTTFGQEQVDLNYREPLVLVEMASAMLRYVAHGASLLRFDATHFVWKNSGSTCVHEPQTHAIVKALRVVLDAVDPSVVIINETNVPHAENMTYFGDGTDEVQYVYNFALPALLAHTLQTGDATDLNAWARDLATPTPETGFFNYSSCHDGVAMRGASEILSSDQLNSLVSVAVQRGAQVLYRSTPAGEVPYELCISFFDLVNSPDHDLPTQIRRYMVSQSIVAVLRGMPGVYVGNWFGAQSLPPTQGPDAHPRDVIRERFKMANLNQQLSQPDGRYAEVFRAMREMFSTRRAQPSLHPKSPQQILDLGPDLVVIQRGDQARGVLTAVHNVTGEPKTLVLGPDWGRRDLLGSCDLDSETELAPYGSIWLV